MPDAMEGPATTSALIHAATLVLSGHFLLALFAGSFLRCPEPAFALNCAKIGFVPLFWEPEIWNFCGKNAIFAKKVF